MLYCTVLYCNILYCTVLRYTVLHCLVLYCAMLYSAVVHCIVVYCTILYYTIRAVYRIFAKGGANLEYVKKRGSEAVHSCRAAAGGWVQEGDVPPPAQFF